MYPLSTFSIFLISFIPFFTKSLKQLPCKSDSQCPLLTNGHLNICIGRTHILRSGTFSVGFCADSNIFGDCSTDIDCVLLYRRKGLVCKQAPGHPRVFKQCLQKTPYSGRIACRTDQDCQNMANMMKNIGMRTTSPVDTCVGRVNEGKEGWCWNSNVSGTCKTNFDCQKRGKGSVCGRTPAGGYACFYNTCTSAVVCPTAE